MSEVTSSLAEPFAHGRLHTPSELLTAHHPRTGFFPLTERWHYIVAAQILDMLVVLAMAVLTYMLLEQAGGQVQPQRYLWATVAIGVVCHFGFARGHLYDSAYIRDAVKANRHLLVHWTQIFLFFAALAALTHQDSKFSRLWFLCLYVGGAAAFAFERVVLARCYQAGCKRGLYRKNIVIVGSGAEAAEVVERLGDKSDLRIMGVFSAAPDWNRNDVQPAYVGGMPVRGGIDALMEFSRAVTIDTAILAVPHSTCGALRTIITRLSLQPMEIKIAATSIGLDGIRSTGADISDFAGLALVPVVDKPISEFAFVLKGAVERCLAGLILLMISPLLLICALMIRKVSPGPVFFKQKRVGYKGQEFFIYKFRTMHVSSVPHTMLTRRSDPRIFAFGGLLRKLSIDELPQLFNVLKGDMALIGPRPHMPEARAAGELYFDAVVEYAGRHRVKPGITGWAQVNGWRGPTDTIDQIRSRVQHDLYYIENWSFVLDFRIILRTVFGGFIGKNAY